MAHMLNKIKNELKEQKKDPLYMHDYYNVSLHHPGKLPLTSSPYARLVNSLIEAIDSSETNHLPRVIIVLLDSNCIKHIDFYAYGVSKIIGTMTTWLVNQFNRTVEVCREQLCNIKPGALIHNEPKFIWCRIINKPCKGCICHYATNSTQYLKNH